MSDRVDILLATYNGERFLAAQLESIIAQTHANWRILARDDGSRDGTLDILSAYKRRLGDKIELLEDGKGNLGLVGNFSTLMEAASAPYVAFCDQDDVWLPEKLALGLRAVKTLEDRWGAETPCLSFSDLEVVDSSLASLSRSFWQRENIVPERAAEVSRLLLQNVVTGCTAVLNRRLCALASPQPEGAMVHDWWVALTAAAFGHVSPVPQCTVLYRQHGDNETGSKGYNFKVNFDRLVTLAKTYGRKRPTYARQHRQAVAFHDRFASSLAPADRHAVETFIELPKQRLFKRAAIMSSQRYLPTGFFRKLSFALFFTDKVLRHSEHAL